MKGKALTRFAAVCGVSIALALAACGQPESEQPEALDQEEELVTAYSWQAIAPSTFSEGPPAVLSLSGGYDFAVFSDSDVAVGDRATVSYTMQGEAGRVVRIVLSRHCDQANGSDYADAYVTLTGEPQSGEVTRVFEQAYSCLRVSFHSHDSNPLTLTVSDLGFTKTAPAANAP